MYRPASLQTLRAFEAAVRLRSFSRAAAELGVTHGAISHRIRELEARLEKTLFERRGNAMEPTDAARQVLRPIRQALALIGSVFPSPASAPATQTLRLAVLPSFASQWLVPRLADFEAAHPGIAVALEAQLQLSSVGPGGADAAIRYGVGPWPGLEGTPLISDPMFPACAPAYRDRMALAAPADLARCRLLRFSWQPWTAWFQLAGLALPEPDGVPFDDAGLLQEAAVAGHGVALVRRVIAHDALLRGDLVRLSDIELPFEGQYHYLHGTGSSARREAIEAFGQWLAARLREEFPG